MRYDNILYNVIVLELFILFYMIYNYVTITCDGYVIQYHVI